MIDHTAAHVNYQLMTAAAKRRERRVAGPFEIGLFST